MKELIGKSCKIWIKVEGDSYFYKVRKIIKFNSPHITFLDKFNKEFTFHKDCIMEIREVGEAW